MRPFVTHLCFLCTWALLSTAALGFAQEFPEAPLARSATHLSTNVTPGAAALRTEQQNPGSRDTLKNGALIGAVVGALTTFAFGMYLCHAIGEEGDPPCLPPALLLAAAGAGAGALAGAGIDALRSPQPMVRVAVRF
jgi:hypothetical protein